MGKTMMVRAIEPSYLDFYWGNLHSQIKDAISYSGDEQSPFHVREKILSGRYILLVVVEGQNLLGHCTMSTTEHPNKKILNLVTVGGTRMKEWLKDILEVIETIGRELNCNAIYTCGRKGWERVLKDYTPKYVICSKELL